MQTNIQNKETMVEEQFKRALEGLSLGRDNCCTTVVLPDVKTTEGKKVNVNWRTKLEEYAGLGGIVLHYAKKTDSSLSFLDIIKELHGEEVANAYKGDPPGWDFHPQELVSGGGYMAKKNACYIFYPANVSNEAIWHELGHLVQRNKYRDPGTTTSNAILLCEYHNILAHENKSKTEGSENRTWYVLDQMLRYDKCKDSNKRKWEGEESAKKQIEEAVYQKYASNISDDEKEEITYWVNKVIEEMSKESYTKQRDEILTNICSEIIKK